LFGVANRVLWSETMANVRGEWAEYVKRAKGAKKGTQLAPQIGVVKAYFYDWLKGVVPSREYVIKFAEVVRGDVNEALEAAGYEPAFGPAVSGAQMLFEGLQELERKYERPAVQYLQLNGGFTEKLTPESAEEILKFITWELWNASGRPTAPDAPTGDSSAPALPETAPVTPGES
jgi:hypothetical protein